MIVLEDECKLVFCVGVIWREHVWKRILSRVTAHRRSGLALGALFVPMVLSGYLLQVSVEEGWRDAWRWIHVATSVVWLIFGVVHPLLPNRTARNSGGA